MSLQKHTKGHLLDLSPEIVSIIAEYGWSNIHQVSAEICKKRYKIESILELDLPAWLYICRRYKQNKIYYKEDKKFVYSKIKIFPSVIIQKLKESKPEETPLIVRNIDNKTFIEEYDDDRAVRVSWGVKSNTISKTEEQEQEDIKRTLFKGIEITKDFKELGLIPRTLSERQAFNAFVALYERDKKREGETRWPELLILGDVETDKNGIINRKNRLDFIRGVWGIGNRVAWIQTHDKNGDWSIKNSMLLELEIDKNVIKYKLHPLFAEEKQQYSYHPRHLIQKLRFKLKEKKKRQNLYRNDLIEGIYRDIGANTDKNGIIKTELTKRLPTLIRYAHLDKSFKIKKSRAIKTLEGYLDDFKDLGLTWTKERDRYKLTIDKNTFLSRQQKDQERSKKPYKTISAEYE